MSRKPSSLKRLRSFHREPAIRRQLPLASVISAILAGGAPLAHAQNAGAPQSSDMLQEVVVTAQKVQQNMQDIPISMEAIGSKQLQQLNIANLDDFVEYLPGVTTVKSLGQGGNGIGTTHVYMRGVVSGQDGNHSASQPSVGTYIDEMPTTTIDGSIDVHVYDIARVEVLEGPQGTLYGASSEAGTIRVITNKPDPKKFESGYDVGVTSVYHGGIGGMAEGFVNLPLSSIAAVRLVGWDEHDPGYISNVSGTNLNAGIVNGQRSFPTWTEATGQTLSNTGSANSNYNTMVTRGGRAALKLDLGDNWTVMPTLMGQSTAANGFFAYDPGVGPLQVTHFGPENTQDSFSLAGLTVTGKVSDLDVVYAGGWLTRNAHSVADYSDYSYFYDKYYGSGSFWHGNGATPGTLGGPTEPQEYVITTGHYTKWNNELRVSTPQDWRLSGTAGVFAERQVHEIWEDYVMPGLGGNPYTYNAQGLAQSLVMPGLNNNTIWLTDEERVDRDSAVFGQATFKITHALSATGGLRLYRYDNSLQGFYGYSSNYGSLTGYYPGMNICGPVGGTPSTSYAPFHYAPCTNLDAKVSNTGHTERVTLNYKFDAARMLYLTYSTGYRPGGVNRVYDAQIHSIYPPYQADQLKNYEFGWKTQWFDNRLRFNGAAFLEDWNNFQFSFLGPNSVTVVQNAASARIKGVETDFEWAAGHGWLLSGSATYLDAKLTQDFCGSYVPGTLDLATSCPTQINNFADGTQTTGPLASSGTRLPVVPHLKANLVARYGFAVGDWGAYGQAAYVYQDASVPLLFPVFYQNGQSGQQHLGEMPPYSLVNLSAGISRNGLHIDFAIANTFNTLGQIGRFAECTPTTCNQPYVVPVQPRTFELKFGQKF